MKTITLVKANKPLSARKPQVKAFYVAIPGNAPQNQTGKVTLFIDDEQVGQRTVKKVVLGKNSLSEPFDVGFDNGGAVIRSEYAAPNKFTDSLDKVVIELE